MKFSANFIRTSVLVAPVSAFSFCLGLHWSEVKRRLLPVSYAASNVPDTRMQNVVPKIAEPQVQLESRASQIMRFGYPGFDNLRTFEDFVLSYDRRNRTAHWVIEHLNADRMVYDKSVDRSKCNFHEDDSFHPYFRASNADYKGSGLDRGHLAAAGNHRKSQNAVNQTFLLSNMAPQVGKGFNRDKWNDLEKYVRKLARQNKNVYVCTGPLYLPKLEADGKLFVKYQVIGAKHIAVPTHFFKVVLIERHDDSFFDLESYVLPNKPINNDTPLKSFQVPLESIERAAGFLIFNKLGKDVVKLINGNKK